MKTEIIGRNLPVDDRIRDFAESKLRKLEKFLDEPIDARLTLSAGKHGHNAELHVSYPGGVLKAHDETDGNLRDAINAVAEVVEEQARRAHQKEVDRRRRADSHDRDGALGRWPVEVLEQGSVGGGQSPRVIETRHLHIKPMTVDEAALALDVSEEGFVVFRDAASDRLSVLYKRKDQHYGLIAPEL